MNMCTYEKLVKAFEQEDCLEDKLPVHYPGTRLDKVSCFIEQSKTPVIYKKPIKKLAYMGSFYAKDLDTMMYVCDAQKSISEHLINDYGTLILPTLGERHYQYREYYKKEGTLNGYQTVYSGGILSVDNAFYKNEQMYVLNYKVVFNENMKVLFICCGRDIQKMKNSNELVKDFLTSMLPKESENGKVTQSDNSVSINAIKIEE